MLYFLTIVNERVNTTIGQFIVKTINLVILNVPYYLETESLPAYTNNYSSTYVFEGLA